MPNLIPIEKEKDSDNEIACCGSDDSQHYPYGTDIDFDDEMVDKLALDNIEVGEEVTIISTGFIKSKRERKEEGIGDVDESKNVCIQFTAIQVSPAATRESSPEEILKALYPTGK